MAERLHRYAPDLSLRSDGRTVFGLLVPYGVEAQVNDGLGPYRERFAFGAFARSIRERGDRVKLLVNHDRTGRLPIGRFSSLSEDPAGLLGEARVSKTAAGDEALELVRDGVADAFSVGFRGIRQRVVDGVTERLEAALTEASLVAFPAYESALVAGVRSAAPYDPASDPERRRYRLALDL